MCVFQGDAGVGRVNGAGVGVGGGGGGGGVEAGDTDSLWKGVRNLATMFMEDGVEPEVGASPIDAQVIEGIDYRLGKIHLALSYDFQSLTLTLKILQAQNLPAKDFTGTSDPYVKILLLPDKKHKLLTKVKKKNLNPRWNECFLFEGKIPLCVSFVIYKYTICCHDVT